MHLALALAAVLAVDDVEPPVELEPPVERPAPKPSPERGRRARLIGFSAGAVALGAGAALGAWLNREGTFGRVCAVTAGTLGAAFLVTGVTYLIAWLAGGGARPHGAGQAALVAAVAGLVGLAGGAVAAVLASAPPGVPRGATGVAGGGLMAATGVTVLIATW